MKFTLSWLKDHLDTTAALDTIVETLTRIGLEVESVSDPAKALGGFTIAAVIEAKPHPNADRLRVCIVDTGAGTPVQVVCGAPNARTGMKSVFSPVGTFIPGKAIVLGKGTIRGVDSDGMLCSGAELGISADHDGILDLAADAPVGVAYAAWAGLDDPVIDINLTPNRPDATSIRGIARDLAAAGLGTLKQAAITPVAGAFPCPVGVTLDLAPGDTHLAPLFALRLVRGVRNGASPAWMQKRLAAIGLRPITALVDITNYLTFDQGRPLHVFDAAKVHGGIVVRRAQAGESLLALDGKTYALDPAHVVIADASGVESLAGVMGGEASGCDETTTDVLIESALWDPLTVARTGRSLGISTDARYRFERGVDPAFCLPGLELATRMVLDLCGGTPSNPAIAGRQPPAPPAIDLPWSETRRLTGLDLPEADMARTLEGLGFCIGAVPGTSERVSVVPPTWRPDIEGKADLVEEIVRIAGLDRVASQPLARDTAQVSAPMLNLLQKRTRQSKRALAARGLVEAVTWSFVSRAQAEMFGGGDARLALANPISADLSDMRPSLLPGLAAALVRNANRSLDDLALFEVGQVFLGDGEHDQRIAASAMRSGSATVQGAGRHWSAAARAVSAYDAKADALATLAALGVPLASVQIVPGAAPAWFHPGRSATLQFGPKLIAGAFGEVHPRVLAAMGASAPMVAMEILLDVLPAPKARPTKMKPKLDLSDLPPVTRDFAFIVDAGVRAGDVVKAAQAAERQLISDIGVFDVYGGAGIAAGAKSVGIAVTLQPRERTLTEAEIDAVAARIVTEVGKKTGATLRA